MASTEKSAMARRRAVAPRPAANPGLSSRRAQPVCDGRHVADRDDVTGVAIVDEFRVAARVGAHDRPAREHVLDDGVRKPLGLGAEHAGVGGGHPGRARSHLPREMHAVAQAEWLRQLHEIGALFAPLPSLSPPTSARCTARFRSIDARNRAIGLDRVLRPLQRAQVGHLHDQPVLRPEAQRCADGLRLAGVRQSAAARRCR